MTINLRRLTELLDIEDPRTKVLKLSILKTFGNEREMRRIIDWQCENREQTKCYACEREGGCLILNGVVYLALGELDIATKELENANQHLRGRGDVWNQIIGLSLLGNAYELNRKEHQALREFERAQEVLIRNYQRTHSKEYSKDADDLEQMLRDQLKRIDLGKGKKSTLANRSRFSFPWAPMYSNVQAGPNGPIWVEKASDDQGVFIEEVVLEDRHYEVHSLRQGDAFISLSNDKDYGWARVSGNSMNAAKPVTIFENDFVLFYKSPVADHNDIVIASCIENSGAGYRYVVKRYDKQNMLLLSETEPPNQYPPIPINEDTRIIGVVIAVAKH